MARRIEHRAGFGYPAQRVHAVLIDEVYLRERLARIGGERSELVSHEVAGDTVRAVMHQGIDAQHLPPVVQRVAGGGVLIERTETWPLASGEPYRGTIEASVRGMPGSLDGATVLAGTADGSELELRAQVRVSIPLVGGKIEAVISEQLGLLLRAEAKFTQRWLESR
jgi:hypothetical protein